VAHPEPGCLSSREGLVVGFEELAVEAFVPSVELDLVNEFTRHEPPEVFHPDDVGQGHPPDPKVGVMRVTAAFLECGPAHSTHLALHAEI
jgi:hypothetical protein